MKKIPNIIALLYCVLAIGQSQNQNYIKTTSYKKATTLGIVNTSNPQDAAIQVTYFDGLGRPMQQIAHKQSATGKDIITPIEYDNLGRQLRKYLPIPVSTNNMLFINNSTVIDDPTSFYTSTYGTDGLFNYSDQSVEASPLNRLTEERAPGMAWSVGTNSVKYDYKTNEAHQVMYYKAIATWDENKGLYEISFANPGISVPYPAGELSVNIVKDEHWISGKLNTTEEYVNKEGQVILKRTFNKIDSNVVPHDTYYVYDQFGNLTYVLPPLFAGSTSNVTLLANLCYQYKYDRRNRLVEKKLPGKQWEFIVYDKLDRVVATGPANSPFPNLISVGWLVTKYDKYNRPIITGWLPTTVTSTTRKNLQVNTLNNQTSFNESKSASNVTVNSIPIRYTNTVWPTTGYHILTAHYYDDYNFPNAPTSFSVVLDGVQQVFYNNTTRKPIGLATGSWTRVLTTSSSTTGETRYSFFDNKARLIRDYLLNHMGGYTYIDTKFDFSGKILYQNTSHKRSPSNAPEISTKEEFTYTPQDLIQQRTHSIIFAGITSAVELISNCEYDELGKLTTKGLGGLLTENARLQKVDYSYNIHGWIRGINSIENLIQGAGAPGDLFAMKLNYNTLENSFGNPAVGQLNGNISEALWLTASDNSLRKYGYLYDDLNRLTEAIYQKPILGNPQHDPIRNSYNEEIRYDKNGNITYLYRNGYIDDSATNVYNIDELNYFYDTNSNVLRRIDDRSNSLDGFRDGNKNKAFNPTHYDWDYEYDGNGNMTKDWNKGINLITYNHLNLPSRINFQVSQGEKFIAYIYNALGQKVSKHVLNQSPADEEMNVMTDYLSGFHYTDGTLQFFPTAEGYVSVTNGERFNYVYNYLDHLGNIRLSYTKEGSSLRILEENHYYPFGMKHNYNREIRQWEGSIGSGGIYAVVEEVRRNKYQYKYNRKEFQDELGLGWYDYQARNYDPAIGRWMNIDPLADQYRRWSPYNYTMNNPVRFIDPDGMGVGDYFSEGGEYLGTDNIDDKKIHIVQNTKLADAGLAPEYGPMNTPEGFYNNDGSVDATVGQGASKELTELSVGDRIKAAEGILGHYFEKAGFNLGDLQSETIENMPHTTMALGLARVGGITPDSEYLSPGNVAILVEYSSVGRILNNPNDFTSLFQHEMGRHVPDLKKSGYSMGLWTLENRAFMQQLNHSSWGGASEAFKKHMFHNQSYYLYPNEKNKYFPKR